jgi:hypothetical protein
MSGICSYSFKILLIWGVILGTAQADNTPFQPPKPPPQVAEQTPQKQTVPKDVLADARKVGAENVRIIHHQTETVTEFRRNGILLMIKVTPKNSILPAYYLVDSDGDGQIEQQQHDLVPNILLSSWVLFSW